MGTDWKTQALLKVEKVLPIHRVERAELIEMGLAKFSDSFKELALTEFGVRTLNHSLSPDYASKRY